MIKTVLFTILYFVSIHASADKRDDQVVSASVSDSPGSSRCSGIVDTCAIDVGAMISEYESNGYSLVGQADDGSYVLHTIGHSDGFVASHELLSIKPLPKAGYVVEKFETIYVDDLHDASVKLDGNAIVVTLFAP